MDLSSRRRRRRNRVANISCVTGSTTKTQPTSTRRASHSPSALFSSSTQLRRSAPSCHTPPLLAATPQRFSVLSTPCRLLTRSALLHQLVRFIRLQSCHIEKDIEANVFVSDWIPGDDVIIAPAVKDEEARKLFPNFQAVKPYLRFTPLPKNETAVPN